MDTTEIAVHRDHVICRVAVPLAVIQQHRIGRLPVAGIDDDRTVQFIPYKVRYLGVELPHRYRPELEQRIESRLAGLGRRAGEVPDVCHGQSAVLKVIPGTECVTPFTPRCLKGSIFVDRPVTEQFLQPLPRTTTQVVDRPEKEAVLILYLEYRKGGLFRQHLATENGRRCVEQIPQPRLVCTLQGLIEK